MTDERAEAAEKEVARLRGVAGGGLDGADDVSRTTYDEIDDSVVAPREPPRDGFYVAVVDGEGATRLISLQVTGAGSLEAARSLSRAAISSNLFKCSSCR